MILISTPEEIKQAAFDWNTPVNQELPMPERVLWYSLKETYKKYKDGSISKAEGEKEVQEAMAQYRIDSTMMALQRMQIQHQADMWKNIETIGSAYRKDRTLDNADKFIETVYGLMPTR